VSTPKVAEGPYALSPNGDIVAADGTAVGRVPVRWNDLRVDDFDTVRDGWTFAEERARMEGSLLAASWDLLRACEAATALLTASKGTLDLESAYAVRNGLDAAIEAARGTPAAVAHRYHSARCEGTELGRDERRNRLPFHRHGA